jgi:hypothetical protein
VATEKGFVETVKRRRGRKGGGLLELGEASERRRKRRTEGRETREETGWLGLVECGRGSEEAG